MLLRYDISKFVLALCHNSIICWHSGNFIRLTHPNYHGSFSFSSLNFLLNCIIRIVFQLWCEIETSN